MRLGAKKSIAAARSEVAETKPGALCRTLGPWSMIALGVGGVVGAGIFVITGTAAAEYAGPAVAVSFLVAALACLLSGLCYAELASTIPVAGSAYTYTYVALGELPAWLVGWVLILEYLVAGSLVAVGWSAYFTSFMTDLGWAIPARWSAAPFDLTAAGVTSTDALVNLPAVFIIAVVAFVLCLGIRQSAGFSALVVALKVSVVVLFIAFGLAHANPDNWRPFIPANEGMFGQFGWSGVLRGGAVVFVAYLGFDAVSTAAQEAREPHRTVPIGILGSLAVVTVLYVLMSLAMTGLVPYTQLDVAHPVDVALAGAGSDLAWLKPLVSIATVVGLSSVILMILLGQSRVFFAMSRDGLLPPLFSQVHATRHTPVRGTLVVAAAAATLAGLTPARVLAELIAIGTLTAFAAVCVAVLVLRRTEPGVPRPFRVPAVPAVPLLGMAWCVLMMFFLPGITWIAYGVWLAIGLAVYGCYGARHSRQAAVGGSFQTISNESILEESK